LRREGSPTRRICAAGKQDNTPFDIDGRLFCLHKELAAFPYSKAVIRILDALFHADGLFQLDLFAFARQALLVVHIPAQCCKEGIYKLVPQLRLIVPAASILIYPAAKALHKLNYLTRCRHGNISLIQRSMDRRYEKGFAG
jgi:hypothetical protein